MSGRAIVIGGGPAGIKAAHELVKAGAQVTLLESAPVLGGLASVFDVQGLRIERYYHFICKGDDHLIDTLEELGLSHKLRWRDSRMAYFVDGTLYPFLTPVELLRFRALPLHDRVRAGAAVKLAQRMREEDLAPLKATAWLRRMFGDRTYRVIWEPLMRFKFAEHADEVSAAWIWARMVRLSRSRTSAWREELGYVEGGSATVIEALGEDFRRRGGRIVLDAPVEQILMEGGQATGVRVGGETMRAEAVISTVTTSRFRQLARGLDGDYVRGLERIPTIGIFCLFLRLREQVTPFFWVNTHDPRVPFAGMIEYTNLNPLPELGGDRILYVPQYLSRRGPALRPERRGGAARVHRCPRPHQPGVRPPLGGLLRGVPRPLRAADLPDRLPDDHALHPDAALEPVPHRLLPAPPARPHDQRVVRARHRGGSPRGRGLEGDGVRPRTRRGPARWVRRERRGVRPDVRGRGDAVVVRGHARHQPVPPGRGVAGRRRRGAADPRRRLRHRQQPRSSPPLRADGRRRPLGRRAALCAAARGVAATRGNLLALPFPDGRFDAVTSFDVLYHRWVADDRVAVREIARVLRPGGLLLVRVPALKMLWGAHDEAVHSRHRYTRGEVRRLLEGEGWRSCASPTRTRCCSR